ncbi:hypothetical protein MKX01_005875 [Papaver californicum]|nr:hypothetical protein MKX01_005875 [Papaver californicum]
MFNHMSKRAWMLSVPDHGLQVSDCTAEGLTFFLLFSQMASEIVGEKLPTESLYDAVEIIFSLQQVVANPVPTVKRISGLSILDNNAVNQVSILLTTLLTALPAFTISHY